MGILQKYTENGSEYKSLKFGKDKPGGGSSNEPFMKKDINTAEPIQPGLLGFPSVLRGGIYSEALAATDVARLTKYFLTPDGIQFALNQNLLSRLAPRTEASGVLNEYIYTPLSTLAQAGVGNLGVHLYKQGLDPTGLTSYSIKKYGEVVYENNLPDPNEFTFNSNNRLVNLLYSVNEDVSLNFTSNPTILSYDGGPGSILGVGKTKIQFATKADGVTPLKTVGFSENNPKTYLTPGTGSVGLSIYYNNYKVDIEAKTTSSYASKINSRLKIYGREIVDETKYNSIIQTLSAYASGSSKPVGTYNSDNSLYVDRDAADANPELKWNLHKTGYLANLNKSAGYYVRSNGEVLYDTQLLGNNGIGPDFRTTNRNIRGFKDQNIAYYDHVTEYSDYWTTGKTVDHIYYETRTKKGTDKRESTEFGSSNDIIPFRIDVINTNNSTTTQIGLQLNPIQYIFRAYVDNLSDSYDADWSAQTYMGRGEKLYKYNTFGRTMSLGFTVVAEGPHHLEEMYTRLNQLASSLAPTYTTSGYMTGNIHKLTIGNYINNQYGIITGFTYDIDNESPWEINKNSQLPHIIKVTGFKFTPIHDFRPEYNTPNSPDFIAQNATINTARPSFTPPSKNT